MSIYPYGSRRLTKFWCDMKSEPDSNSLLTDREWLEFVHSFHCELAKMAEERGLHKLFYMFLTSAHETKVILDKMGKKIA